MPRVPLEVHGTAVDLSTAVQCTKFSIRSMAGCLARKLAVEEFTVALNILYQE